jgi:hypothetical protein
MLIRENYRIDLWDGNMADVFISYSHKDGGYAHRLADELRSHQIEVWIDDRIDYGDQWPRVIQDNLAACRIFIVLMSSRSFNSMWVQNEVSYAQANQKTVFPLLLEGDVWLSMSARQYVDVQTGEMPPEKFFDRLKRELNKPISSAPRPTGRVTRKPGILKNRQLVYIGGSLLLLTALSCFLFLGLWVWGSLSPTPTQPAEIITSAPTGPTLTEEPITEPPPVEPIATPLYEAGVITFITRTEAGQALYILERDGSQRPLMEDPGMQGLKVLSISPPPKDPSEPRYLAVSYTKDDMLHVVVLNMQDASTVPIAQGADSVEATYLEDGRLLVEIKDDNTGTYSLHQMDGSNPAVIYTTVLTLPTSTPTATPEGAQ